MLIKEKPQQIYAVLGRLDNPNRIKSMEELREKLHIKMKSGDKPVDLEEGEVKYEILE